MNDTPNKTYNNHYAQEDYGYTLLQLKKTTVPKRELKPFDYQNFSHLQSLFKLSFKKYLSPELWQWKYANQQAQALCVWEENNLVGHYGGMPRDILFFGEPKMAVQIGDVMVDPSNRGALSRKGPFFLMAATFIDHYIGFEKPFLLGFGFPNRRAMQVAEHLGLYASVGQMLKFSWPVYKLDRVYLPRYMCWRKNL